ncbi:MAG TPA: cysteine-rich CWC family protein [Burkholderiaceae bacterium]|nr:cysteine-rich CWC family protein [Burkholderiaceae bacterium]
MAAEASTGSGRQGEDARCPRCGRAFHCGIDDPQPCACTTLRLSAATLAELRGRYRGCLCVACLSELAHAPRSVRQHAARQRR